MAKPLIFSLNGQTVDFQMTKVDRAKLYGYKELLVLDENGETCEMATLAEDGHTVVGKGGTGMGYLSADGQWCDKSQLTPVDVNGEPIDGVASSFSAPIILGQPTSADDYLAHTIRGIYLMESEEGGELAASIRAGAIYRFPYSFRGGLEADQAFLLANQDGEIFMAVGSQTKLDFIGLQQSAPTVSENDTEEEDDLSFDMI